MSTEHPLHVQVAEALGWTEIRKQQDGMAHEITGAWIGTEPHGGLTLVVPQYDRSWCSVGPLVQRFEISIIRENPVDYKEDPEWEAWYDTRLYVDGYTPGASERGATPCKAVAKLIVLLKKEGKLNV